VVSPSGTVVGNTSITLAWTAGSALVGAYAIDGIVLSGSRRALSSASYTTLMPPTLPSAATMTFVVTGLTPDTAYGFRIWSLDDFGNYVSYVGYTATTRGSGLSSQIVITPPPGSTAPRHACMDQGGGDGAAEGTDRGRRAGTVAMACNRCDCADWGDCRGGGRCAAAGSRAGGGLGGVAAADAGAAKEVD
jgi:hypothetical protein